MTASARRRVGARGAVRLIGLGAATFAWLSAATLHESLVPTQKRGPIFQRYMKRWGHSLVRRTGGRVFLAPGSVVPAQLGPRLVVANHRSPFDIGILLSLFGGHALSRADLADWPVLGVAAQRAGTIFVDRTKADSGASAIRAIRKKLIQQASILLFPEGSTFQGDEVRPFKPGAFTALRNLNAQIVPVGLAYDPGAEFVNESFVAHVLRVAQRPRTRCVVAIGEPIAALGKPQELAETARDQVQRLVDQARADWTRRFG
jgi:1-acyl-sn-glycerol-3-phosphate acyltransferase